MEDKQITLQIDGHFITVPEGSTILEAATKIGINIPTLCHIDLKGTCIKNEIIFFNAPPNSTPFTSFDV